MPSPALLHHFPAFVLLAFCVTAHGGSPHFRRHDINANSTYCACAALDVNRDGRLDIVSGGWWYEAPTWTRHFLREVQSIRGRYDDYSNLPLDVNGDGWTDVVSANYRSRSIYWVQNPGAAEGPWAKHEIDVPGAMETGRLADVNDDGHLDLLPNGLKFAAWWELIRDSDTDGSNTVRWQRHDLPLEVAGHGVGIGDINGDGRSDILGPRGWLEAPLDRRADRWLWHGDFDLDRDCSIPILSFDVDRDGDTDLVWGRGHNIGLYWMEQARSSDSKKIKWIRHVIDTSWSQPHSILLADVDGDDQMELVAGKRYMGHDGKDPGEYDPLAIYWYDFDNQGRTWKRGTISEGGPAGVGLDPKAIDLDGDSDVDVLVAGRSGLFLFENLLADGDEARSATIGDGILEPTTSDHTDLTVYPDRTDSATDLKLVTSPEQWALRRADILVGMQTAMGPLPDSSRRVPLDVRVIERTEHAHYVRQKITYASEPDDRVPAYLMIPKGIQSRTAAMLCLHQTTKIGKDEPAGMGPKKNLHYAHELAQRGYVCIVPDYPSFGEYPFDFQKDGAHYESGSMKAIWNNIRALDVLETVPQVDRDRIGCIGHSLGGHNSLFTAVFDQRIRAVVTSCGFTAFANYYDGNLRGWTSDRYMPRIREVYGNDPSRVPFDFHEVLAAIAPRGVFVNAPCKDANFDRDGVEQVITAAGEVYKLIGKKENLRVVYPDADHDFPDDVRRAAYEWLEAQLRM